MNIEKLLFIGCCCLLATLCKVSARGGPKLDLGPLSEDDEDAGRSCADVMAVFEWISCEEDGNFSALQCNPTIRRCFCLQPDGTRASNRVFRQDRVSADVCAQTSSCPELTCQIACDEYMEDPITGCKICECEPDEDDREDCPTADEVATRCARSCIMKDDDGCLECTENCSGDDDDECDDDECPSGGICVARGNFAARKCLKSEREDGQTCEREEDENVQSINARRLLRGAASRRNIRNFRSARIPCKNGSVCVPYNGRTGSGVCQKMDDIDGPCFDNSTGLECDDSGMFLPVQCSDDDCWCVDPVNGTEISDTRVNRRRARVLPDCFDLAYESCVIVVRDDRYRVEHNRFGLDVSNCRRCICQNGRFNDSTCVNGRDCTFITPGGGPQDCNFNGAQYRHRDVFQVDECNRCKCLNGRISGCTRRKCRNNDDDDDDNDDETPCDTCRRMPYDPVCGPNGVTYRNLCTAQFCAGLDPLEITDGPCSTQDPCENFPCEEGLTCVPKKITCTTRRGCSADQYRMCINDTDIDCPVDDKEEVCGSDGKTYSSVCRMLIESDDVYAIYDGPCNQTECEDAPICGTDFVTYPNICVLRSQSSNTRADYEGNCEQPSGEETLDEFCERIRETRCRNLTGCESIVQPTDGCCPICGGIVTVALDEEGLAEYAELFDEVQSLDGLLERIVTSGIISDSVLNTCEISAYITSTGNLEIIFEAIDVADALVCFTAAEEFADFINGQGDGTISEITPDPSVSFLTAASSLEQEEQGGSITTNSPGGSGAYHILPSVLLLLSLINTNFLV